MRLTSLFISIDNARKLEKLGIKQVSCFYWYQEKVSNELQLFKSDMTQLMMPWKYSIGKPSNENNNIFTAISAFTSSEIGEILPKYIQIAGNEYALCFIYKGLKGWNYDYSDTKNENPFISTSAETEQDARAQLLIAILEAGFISIENTIIK